jgi:nucleotide-binding universal stress UspA family protein
MKILYPIALTNASLCGYKYAERLCVELNAKLIAINIIPSGPQSKAELKTREAEKKLRENKIMTLTREYPDLCNHKVIELLHPEYVVKFGNIVSKILSYVEDNNIDLVIIGTKAKHNILEYVFGSISTELMRRINIPVIIIPEGTAFQNIHHITHAIDMEKYDPNTNSFVRDIAKKLNAKISLVHVEKMESDDEINTEEIVALGNEQLLKTGAGNVSIIKNPSVVEGLDHYLNIHKSDLLALRIQHKTKSTEILKYSLSKVLVFKSKVPLLLFK